MKIHRWLGLALCLALLVISLTGVLLVWKKEILWLTIPAARDAINTDIGDLARSIETIESLYPPGQVQLIQLHSENLSLHKVFLSGRKTAWHDQQGVKLQQWQGNERWEDWLLDLHHRFLMGNKIGLNIAGFSGLLVVPLMLIGLIIWWPRRRQLKRGVIPASLAPGSLILSHGNLGFIAFLPLLLISISGVILVYPEQSKRILVDSVFDEARNVVTQDKVDSLSGASQSGWSQVLQRSLSLYPRAQFRWVAPPSGSSPYRMAGLQQVDEWNRSGQTTVYVHADNGKMIANLDALKKTRLLRAYNFSYPLHTGKLGLWYRILLSLSGLAMVAIALFGASSWLKR